MRDTMSGRYDVIDKGEKATHCRGMIEHGCNHNIAAVKNSRDV